MTLIIVVESSVIIEKSDDNLFFELEQDDNLINKIKFIILSSFLTCNQFIIYIKKDKYSFDKKDILNLLNLELANKKISTALNPNDVSNKIADCLPVGKIFEYIKNIEISSIYKRIKLTDTELESEILVTDFYDQNLYKNYRYFIYLTLDDKFIIKDKNLNLIDTLQFENLFLFCYSGSAVPSKT